LSGLRNFEEKSGVDIRNPNNKKPEKPDPKNSGNPNAQREPQHKALSISASGRIARPHRHLPSFPWLKLLLLSTTPKLHAQQETIICRYTISRLELTILQSIKIAHVLTGRIIRLVLLTEFFSIKGIY
jgi:hypothetical protein